jgi:hypothetical protein
MTERFLSITYTSAIIVDEKKGHCDKQRNGKKVGQVIT